MSKMLRFVGLGLRLGVCGGSVLYMHEQGVFGDIKQGVEAYKKLNSVTIKDLVGEEISSQLPSIQLPQEVESGVSAVTETTSDIKKNFWFYWNCGVNSVFSGLVNLPSTTLQYANLAVQKIQDSIKE
ncbi:uncharacterized protein LOC111716174 [Eurytemora carolleeae]|uniref:uncharacterized protein LOC111716174 n=1 Tax=Eurytemora carolleeae TaxID=1294199 RepID=UPI000C77435F|nr:uncharacterized protein LOC111716174 [Eurytemora carolleeae]|eukprot:XP_023347372.1 uncharacterized protein LOC111716174 [Eurytemora affinis]